MKTLLITAAIILSATSLRAQRNDPMFAEEGRTKLTISSGSPFIAVGEIAYGISDGVTVGAIGGATPILFPAIGFRIRGVLDQPVSNVRLYVTAATVLCNRNDFRGDQIWAYAWPTFNIEWQTEEQRRYWACAGVIGAVNVERVLADGPRGDTSDYYVSPNGQVYYGNNHPRILETSEKSDKVWQTIGAGISIPTGARSTYHAEASIVMDGFSLANWADWNLFVPVIVKMAWTYDL